MYGRASIATKSFTLTWKCIVIDGKAYALIGDSGAGKTTLASAFLNRGYQPICDDVIPIILSAEGVSIVISAYPQ